MAIPTITGRAAALRRALESWRALGAEPAIASQDAALPLGHASQTVTALAAIRAALKAPGVTHVLYAEDDAVPSPGLGGHLPVIMDRALTIPVALWTPRIRFLPAPVRRAVAAGEPLPSRLLTQARGLRDWWGSVAVLIPAEMSADLAALPPVPGFDMHLRAHLRSRGLPLLVAVPNLVQHDVTVARAATRSSAPAASSGTFGWLVEEDAWR